MENNKKFITVKESSGAAAILSLIIPGLGQLYKGQIFNGIAWFFIVIAGYMALFLPGLVLHLFCIIGASATYEKKLEIISNS